MNPLGLPPLIQPPITGPPSSSKGPSSPAAPLASPLPPFPEEGSLEASSSEAEGPSTFYGELDLTEDEETPLELKEPKKGAEMDFRIAAQPASPLNTDKVTTTASLSFRQETISKEVDFYGDLSEEYEAEKSLEMILEEVDSQPPQLAKKATLVRNSRTEQAASLLFRESYSAPPDAIQRQKAKSIRRAIQQAFKSFFSRIKQGLQELRKGIPSLLQEDQGLRQVADFHRLQLEASALVHEVDEKAKDNPDKQVLDHYRRQLTNLIAAVREQDVSEIREGATTKNQLLSQLTEKRAILIEQETAIIVKTIAKYKEAFHTEIQNFGNLMKLPEDKKIVLSSISEKLKEIDNKEPKEKLNSFLEIKKAIVDNFSESNYLQQRALTQLIDQLGNSYGELDGLTREAAPAGWQRQPTVHREPIQHEEEGKAVSSFESTPYAVAKDYYAKNDRFPALKAAAASEQGRRRNMEDTHCAASISVKIEGRSREGKLLALFDGHGSMTGENEVSQLLQRKMPGKIQAAIKSLQEAHPSATEEQIITNAFHQAFSELHSELRGSQGVGSTAIVTLVLGDTLWVANLGDSRAILVKKDGSAIDCSRDQKATDPDNLERVYLAGGFSQIQTTPQGIRLGGLAIGNSFGDVDIVAENRQPLISALPTVSSFPLEAASHLVVACDGLWDVASSQAVASYVHGSSEQGENEETIAKRLVQGAIRLDVPLPAPDAEAPHPFSMDNVSVMVMKLA